MADRKISELTALTTPATGDLIPIVDISEVAAADKNKSITVGELLRGAPDGTAAAPGFAFESDGGNGMFLGGTDILAFSTGGSQAVTIDASQRLGVGTSTPTQKLEVQGSGVLFGNGTSDVDVILGIDGYGTRLEYSTGKLFLRTNSSNRLTVDNTGKVGIGDTAPDALLVIKGDSDSNTTPSIRLKDGTDTREAWISNASGDLVLVNGGDDNVPHCKITLFDANIQSFETANTERMRIDSSGNVGIGTTTVVAKAHVSNGSSSVTPNASADELFLENNGNVGLQFGCPNTGNARISFGDPEDAQSGLIFYDHSNNHLRFDTAATERVRIDSSGSLLVGKTVSSIGTDGTVLNNDGRFYCTIPNSTAYHLYSSAASAYRFYVDETGTINATVTTISAISDQRLKENIRDLDTGLTEILALQPRRFDWKEGKGRNIQGDQGFIAQEFEQVFPEMIGEWLDPAPEGEEPYKSVRADLIPVLVKAIQEQQAIINGLEARLAALEAQ